MCCDHAENQLRICLDLSGYVREYLFELIFVSFFFGVLSELIKDLSLTTTMAVSTFTHEYVLSCPGKKGFDADGYDEYLTANRFDIHSQMTTVWIESKSKPTLIFLWAVAIIIKIYQK